MSDTIMRYVLVRPVAHLNEAQVRKRTIDPYAQGLSAFGASVADVPASRARALSAELIDSQRFVRTLQDLPNGAGLLRVHQWVEQHPALDPPMLREALCDIFPKLLGAGTDKLMAALQDDALRLADSLLALVLARRAELAAQRHAVRGLRIWNLIARAYASDVSPRDLQRARRAIVVLPVKRSTVKPPPQPETSAARDALGAGRGQYDAMLQELGSVQAALHELPRVYAGKLQKMRLITGAANLPLPFSHFTAGELVTLSAEARAAIDETTLPAPIPDLVATLEHRRAGITGLFGGAINWLPGATDIPGAPYSPPLHTPVPTAAPAEASGNVRSAGIGDLLLVRQNLIRYEMGEIAHIENVMMGESFSRTFKRSETQESTQSTDEEVTETTERDLQSTAKSELKTEIARSVKEDMQASAGLTVTARGPSVEVTADAQFEYTRSSEDSSKTATEFAKEIVERSISRLQTRTLKQRSERTARAIEETSIHSLKNEDPDHQVGVYRWVDKIYQAQVVNYGKRTMLEVMIPEPAALYQFAIRNGSPELSGDQPGRPEAPLVRDRWTAAARPLQVADLTEDNYMLWVSKYAVEGVLLPPARFKRVSLAIDLPKSNDVMKVTIDSVAVDAPKLSLGQGYAVTEYEYLISGARQSNGAADSPVLIAPQIGNWNVGFLNLGTFSTRAGHTVAADFAEGPVPVSFVAGNICAGAANVAITGQRTERTLDAWKLQTFQSIMIKYARLESDYLARLEAAAVQEGVVIAGRNPAGNRLVERNELKRLAITMMTGQHFDRYGAMKGPDSTHVFPQMAVEQAHEQGGEARLIEQAIEWNHISYLFYPYYWARKSRWVELLNLEDVDPLFARFLTAGFARVQLPVRPGFEAAIDVVLAGGMPRGGVIPPPADMPHLRDGEEPVSGVPLVPIVDEIQDQLGLEFKQGPGTISVTQNHVAVHGDGTAFATEEEGTTLATQDREIRIAGVVYRVRQVISPTELVLASPYAGASAHALPYALGPRLVGEPWDVRLPTTLVILQGLESQLAYGASAGAGAGAGAGADAGAPVSPA